MPDSAASPQFCAAHARTWLRSPAVVDRSGHVMSWDNPAHPGYRYPEAAGLWLSLHRSSATADPIATQVATTLMRTAHNDDIGRNGVRYLFDEGVVLAGLLRHQPCAGARLQPLYRRFMGRLARRETTRPALAPRWSTIAGPHLLKLSVTVGAWPDVSASDRSTLLGLLRDTLRWCDGGRCITDAAAGHTYVHAHCYAVEGALRLSAPDLLDSGPREDARAMAHQGAAWLAQIQQPGGGIPAWHDGTRAWGPQPADATAQAIRIWALSDPTAYTAAIDQARAYLDRLTAPSGALRYSPECADHNTWATVFAVQATAWTSRHAEKPAYASGLI